MPKIVGGSERVVDFEGLTIDELAGNVATKEDRISIALVKVKQPSSEPWLTLDYDEWMCVLKGRMVLLSEDGAKEMEVAAGQTVFIARGERFRPTFPDGDTEYVPVCLPAFRPDRCIREDGPESEVSAKLQKLHGDAQGKATAKAKAGEQPPEVLYHMCEKVRWEAAKAAGQAYYPPTFEGQIAGRHTQIAPTACVGPRTPCLPSLQLTPRAICSPRAVDGNYTHATGVPPRLIETANHVRAFGSPQVLKRWLAFTYRCSLLIPHVTFSSPLGERSHTTRSHHTLPPHTPTTHSYHTLIPHTHTTRSHHTLLSHALPLGAVLPGRAGRMDLPRDDTNRSASLWHLCAR